LRQVTNEPGVNTAAVGGEVIVIRQAALGQVRTETFVLGGPTLTNLAETPLVTPNVRLARLGPRELSVAVLLPHGAREDDSFPVLMDPYGGPHAQRVVASNGAYLTSQWFADQGFAVVVVDGRGTPGRGSEWERAVHGDLAQPVLDDQVDGLIHAAREFPQLDLSRVAIRGWSFGGYLAALAALRRPDIFHAAIAGAPVTEWRLYDTHYTERYLGDPNDHPGVYDRSSLLVDAQALSRPLLLIHGLADDNVVVAHTLQLSSALLGAGRHHEVLALSGVSHMTPQAVVAENLLAHQLAFLRKALALP
jgi:dipeptidyl-peptidase-4